MQELRANAMMATPTYVLGMAATARNALSIDPTKDLHVQKITCAGEPGALVPSTKKRIEEAWGAKVYDHAGATEIGAWGFECEFQPGALHVNEAMFLAEVEDPDTGEPITEPGKPGKLVITALDRIAQPCIRFDSKDLVEIGSNVCECGRTFMMFQGGVIGRADDITKVKGVLLSPSAIEDVVRSFSELSDEYEVIVDKRGDADHILLKVELAPGISENRKPEVEEALRTQLRVKTNLGYALEFHDHGSLPRYEVKARRFKDLRK
jgi:phenylacetate-CoA ligase